MSQEQKATHLGPSPYDPKPPSRTPGMGALSLRESTLGPVWCLVPGHYRRDADYRRRSHAWRSEILVQHQSAGSIS